MTEKSDNGSAEPTVDANATCGIIMPISSIGDCDDKHWREVRLILEDAITKAGLKPRLVSESSDAAIIPATIVTNVYEDELVVCDVSQKNANVTFELGLRIAFGKPVVIVKDDQTDYTFDISPIEHLRYPRTLRHPDIEQFKSELSTKLLGTHNSVKNGQWRSYLQAFGPLKAQSLEAKPVDVEEILRQLTGLRHEIRVTQNKEIQPPYVQGLAYRYGLENDAVVVKDAIARLVNVIEINLRRRIPFLQFTVPSGMPAILFRDLALEPREKIAIDNLSRRNGFRPAGLLPWPWSDEETQGNL